MSPKKNTYKHQSNALCLTLHSIDGSVLAVEARKEAEKTLEDIAKRYHLVINVATT